LSWDLFCKALLKECAQDFVTYFVPGARYVGMRESQLQTRVDGPFDAREIRGDGVPEAERDGALVLTDVEWQSTREAEMADRLLGYNCELTRLHGLPVLSVVIYVRPVSSVPRAPLVRSIPGEPVAGGSPVLRFDYVSLEVCATPVEAFRVLNLDGFTVLMLLCQGGGTVAVLEEVLARLLRNQEKRKEAIAATFFFASQVLKTEKDLRFLERHFLMLEEILEDNWIYRRMIGKGIAEGLEKGIAEGLEKGTAEGLEKGIAKGHLEEARQNVEDLVVDRFPALLTWVKGQVEQIQDLETLRTILRVVGRATTPEEIKAAFPIRQ